jgi:ATP-binding protein involved in chromosome partitioning
MGTHAGEAPKAAIPGVKRVVAVGSGKGGVGKTTVAVNLAIALARLGPRTGLLDADIYGPNVPLMVGTDQLPEMAGRRLLPLERHGIKMMSMGFLSPGDEPVIWRGPMLHHAMRQFLHEVEWGELDYLVVDLPPGTGDVQLSLIQTVPITGAIVVTTPSDVALGDARKAVRMFRQVRVPVLGMVENMSYLVCPHCQGRVEVFSYGGGQRTAIEMGVPFLAELPLDSEVRVGGDTGFPVAARDGMDPRAGWFLELARRTADRVAEVGVAQPPPIEITD